MKRDISGFTLMELMIAVVVLAVLSMIAVPQYVDYVHRAKRSDARAALLQVANLQAKYFSNTGAYTNSFTALGHPQTSSGGHYSLSINLTAAGFSLTAQAIQGGDQAKDEDCRSFSITHVNQLSAKNKKGNDSSPACWPTLDLN